MIEDLLTHPDQTVEKVAEAHLRAELSEVPEEELKKAMAALTFIDLYVRYTFRGRAVQELVDAGDQGACFSVTAGSFWSVNIPRT